MPTYLPGLDTPLEILGDYFKEHWTPENDQGSVVYAIKEWRQWKTALTQADVPFYSYAPGNLWYPRLTENMLKIVWGLGHNVTQLAGMPREKSIFVWHRWKWFF